MFDLSFEPVIPGALWLVLALAGVAMMVVYARRRPVTLSPRRWGMIVGLMSLAMALVLGLLLNPTWARPLPPPAGKPVLTVLVDSSGSMATPDAAGDTSRFAAAAHIAAAMSDQLTDRYDVRIRSFDNISRTIAPAALEDMTPAGPGTDLTTAIDSGLAEAPPQGQAMVLLSDGIDNAGGGTTPILAAVRTARAMATPIYTKTFGTDASALNLAVDIRTPQDVAVVGQRVPIVCRVSHTGFSRGKATVHLIAGGKEIDHRDAILEPTAPTEVTFFVSQPKVGVYPYEVNVDPLPGQVSQANNSAPFVLRVVDEAMHVLVLEGKPYWDSKFLIRTLMSDPAISVDCIVRLSDSRLLHRALTHPKNAATQPANAPTESWTIDTDAAQVLATPENLRRYQVIIIGRDAEPFLTDDAVTNLQNWVAQEGGSLVCYRGSPTSLTDQKLAKLLPVRFTAGASRYRVAMTEQGKDLNWFSFAGGGDALPGLPSLSADNAIDSLKPLAIVLAKPSGQDAPTGDRAATMVYQPYGTGRVVVIEGAGMWRWAFLPPAYQDQEIAYATLWHSMMRWLGGGQGLTPGQMYMLRADKVRFGADESATATLLARADIAPGKLPAVKLQLADASASAAARTYRPAPLGTAAGVFRVDFGPLAEGRYRATLVAADAKTADSDTSHEIVFDVRKYDREQLDLRARPDLMARIGSDSGGSALGSNPVDQLHALFSQHLARVLPVRIERSTAWDRWWILVGVIACWTASWAVRRSGGLV